MTYEDLKDYLEFAYYVSSILLLIGLIVAIRQLRLVKKDMKDRNHRAAVEKSVEHLTYYAQKFIPAYSKYREDLKKEVPKRIDTSDLFDGKFYHDIKTLDKRLVVELIIQQDCGISQLFNELEFFSIAVLEGLVVEEIMYSPVAKAYCQMIENEHVILSVMRSKGAPFKNVIELYRKWKDREEVEEYQLQIKDAKNKIKLKGNSYKSKPPIGTN
ncbi:hypothetical protein DC345_18170 [Paenibacillus taichungensis]|uniref:DUF4760 domain-containing protein n=1 Tax=Paenibacillus taichungensis TaxID=484184 RepID=A0A329QMX1_9BACL|nr:hypothetical protein [Paenibacillus taichungensis]RAW13715.1 hypothetical protein DC345_18170 [Paenibacillus taichungensis]